MDFCVFYVKDGKNMFFRKATKTDVKDITDIYERVLDREETGETSVGWVRGVYPTENTVIESLKADELFVAILNEKVVAAARINRVQVPEYANAAWKYKADDNKVMVLHALAVDPLCAGRGIGSQFVKFYEEYAVKNNCPYLRMDTNERNKAARSLYKKLGFDEVGIVPCVFNGIEGVKLVCLEKCLINKD